MIEPTISYIVKRGNEYLVCIPYGASGIKSARFSIYAWDAARIGRLQDAHNIAKLCGGEVRRFSNTEGLIE